MMILCMHVDFAFLVRKRLIKTRIVIKSVWTVEIIFLKKLKFFNLFLLYFYIILMSYVKNNFFKKNYFIFLKKIF